MGLFGTIQGGLGSSPSLLMIIVLGVADQLWGENLFNCPCGGQYSRMLFTLPFLAVPPVIIITVDTPWRFVRTSCKCDLTMTCCRWVYRPIIIAAIWIVFSLLQPKFGQCMFTVVSCNCTVAEIATGCDSDTVAGREKAAYTRVAAACVTLAVGVLLLVIGIVFIIWMFVNNQCQAHCHWLWQPCRDCSDNVRKLPLVATVFPSESQMRAQRCLMDTAMAMGLRTKTIAGLQRKGLFESSLQLYQMTEDQLKDVSSCISAGQADVLRRFPKERMLIQTLLVLGLDHKSILKLRDQGIADERLARKLGDDDYRHIATVITKKQLEKLRKVPEKWDLVQALLRAGFEAATLVILREEGFLTERDLIHLRDDMLRDCRHAFSLEQRDLITEYAPKLYLIFALMRLGLNAQTLATLQKRDILKEVTLQNITESELTALKEVVPDDQLDKLKAHAAKLPAYVLLCKEKSVAFDQVREWERSGDPQIVKIIDDLNAYRISNPREERLTPDLNERLEILLSRPIRTQPPESTSESTNTANLAGTQNPGHQSPPLPHNEGTHPSEPQDPGGNSPPEIQTLRGNCPLDQPPSEGTQNSGGIWNTPPQPAPPTFSLEGTQSPRYQSSHYTGYLPGSSTHEVRSQSREIPSVSSAQPSHLDKGVTSPRNLGSASNLKPEGAQNDSQEGTHSPRFPRPSQPQNGSQERAQSQRLPQDRKTMSGSEPGKTNEGLDSQNQQQQPQQQHPQQHHQQQHYTEDLTAKEDSIPLQDLSGRDEPPHPLDTQETGETTVSERTHLLDKDAKAEL